MKSNHFIEFPRVHTIYNNQSNKMFTMGGANHIKHYKVTDNYEKRQNTGQNR